MLPNYVAQLFLIGKEEEWINRQLNFFFSYYWILLCFGRVVEQKKKTQSTFQFAGMATGSQKKKNSGAKCFKFSNIISHTFTAVVRLLRNYTNTLKQRQLPYQQAQCTLRVTKNHGYSYLSISTGTHSSLDDGTYNLMSFQIPSSASNQRHDQYRSVIHCTVFHFACE
ncbi:uncharacterized protein CAALFM_C303020WA [Candida albicans SC5314]|uniref:Uncharacterized protein n=1 Tax=Candida albicans (strain SC5314 / ATCC MYA-2876) TaxID=237561 RepID=Q5AEH0_CANAL|nr:uncharacterized protein CAALFM_C303020WA [Candida albicans SC5314]AOW28333.1 hypothetical protein CAALFM_C303020WA [Candida albicans SC5314]|eukprot:XP_719994.1 hypothetical protein CAALFM_C303020WA [Candida albicans SC5314]